MKLHENLFMEALAASLNNQKVTWDFEISQDTWVQLFELSREQKVLPLIFEAVYSCPAISSLNAAFFQRIKHLCIGKMMSQAQKTAEFLRIYEKMQEQDINPIVVKGIICREFYPNPDLRASADEDLLVQPSEFAKSVEFLKKDGMRQTEEQRHPDTADEMGFLSVNGNIYLELHKFLFSPNWEIGQELNSFFEDAHKEAVFVEVQGKKIAAMEPGMHLFYLICHAFKHFIGSGFGIRQVCDIAMFANAYGEQIDWQDLLEKCKKIRADQFTAAIFKIGKNYLNFDEEKACYPDVWRKIEIDEKELLSELLQSGIYGSSTMSRKHSSHMTLDAVAAQKQGKRQGSGLNASLFPKAKSLESQYTYLKEQPYLLPVAWGERILKYCKETAKAENNNAIDAVKIGNQRIELLKKYGIIEK